MIPGSTTTSSIRDAMPAPRPVTPAFPVELADRCVKCGLCLPHCPTYQVEAVEGESPRGRIALMQGLAGGALDAGDVLVGHLNQCLGCRACETVCPADVPYGQLIDAARGELRKRGIKRGIVWRTIAWAVLSKVRMRIAFGLLRMVLLLRLDRLLRRLARPGQKLARYLLLLPPRIDTGRFDSAYSCPIPKRKGTVSLFVGCMGPALEADTLRAAIRVLNRMGYDVSVPAGQGCCGAIHQHAGYAKDAARLATRNLAAVDSRDPVIVVSTGCLATLREYPQTMQAAGQDQQGTQSFSQRCVDLTRFVAGQVKSHPQRRKLAVHIPCTQRLDPVDAAEARQVAAQLGGGRYEEIGNGQCCGAAGTYLVEEPDLSQSLAQRLDLPDAQDFMTSNIGCRLQIEALCRQRGIEARVLHPVSLIDGDDAAS